MSSLLEKKEKEGQRLSAGTSFAGLFNDDAT